MDVEDSQTKAMPGLQEVRDLGSEDNESKGGKAMTDRAELIDDLGAAKLPHGHSNGTWCRSELTHIPLERRTCDCPAGPINAVLERAIAALEAKEPKAPMTDRAELIAQLHRASTVLLYEGYYADADTVKEAIAAFETKPLSPQCSLTEIVNDVIGNIQNCAAGDYDVAMLDHVLHRVAALEAKPEPKCKTCDDTHTVSAGSSLVDCVCKAHGHTDCLLCKGAGTYAVTAIDDCPDCAWHEPAKPEPKCVECTIPGSEICGHAGADHPLMKDGACIRCGHAGACHEPAKPLPESVRPIAWANKSTAHDLEHGKADNVIAVLTTTMCAANTAPLYSHAELLRLHIQHQSELELLRSKLALVLRENRRLSDVAKAVDHELVTMGSTLESYPDARKAVAALIDWHCRVAVDPAVSSDARALIEQVRREALQDVPLGALERAAKHCDSMMDYETGGIIIDWIESAREAQEKV